MPYDKNGKFYTTRLGEDLKGDDPLGRLYDRTMSARQGARAGAALGSRAGPVGGVLGATLGGISGFILGDQETVFPIDMIAIPAYQAYLLAGTPAFQIYIKEGEVLTQVIPTDAMQSTEIVESNSKALAPKKKRKPSKYHIAYGKHFKAIQADFKLKNGKWKKNGFKRCAASARSKARAEVKK